MNRKNNAHKEGFTIVELLIVIVVIGILAAITIVAFNGVQAKAKTSKAKSDASTIMKKVELYRTLSGSGNDGYPISDQASQHWSTTSDLSSSDPVTKLPSNLLIVRGQDNSSDDSGADYGTIATSANATPATYVLIVCTGSGAQSGAKIAYPNYSTGKAEWIRSGTCPSNPTP